jgi:ATP-dependent Clp protease ATP-binding subunit ClpA
MGIKGVVTLDPNRRSSDAIEFERSLRRQIVGQDQAISAIVQVYQTFIAGMNSPSRPIGNFLFLGPTGCGKTRVAEAIANALYGDSGAIVKVDCAEFQHSHEIAKLIGSPPGYLGHRETHPALSQEILNRCHTEKSKLTVLLFDEIEKSSDALWQLLLGIMDKATLTLGDNRRVDLSHCIIIMTSNLGAREMSSLVQKGLGFVAGTAVADERLTHKMERSSTEAARRRFSPEFINRIDKLVVFKPLQREDMEHILDIELGLVQRRILAIRKEQQFMFNCTERVKEFLLQEGTDTRYGARHLKRAIERHLVAPLANLVASSQVKLGDLIRIDRSPEGEMLFTREPHHVRVVNEFDLQFSLSTLPPVAQATGS